MSWLNILTNINFLLQVNFFKTWPRVTLHQGISKFYEPGITKKPKNNPTLFLFYAITTHFCVAFNAICNFSQVISD